MRDVLLVDKTGTLTARQAARSRMSSALNGWSEQELLALAASAERYSEHPLAEAVRAAAARAGACAAGAREFRSRARVGRARGSTERWFRWAAGGCSPKIGAIPTAAAGTGSAGQNPAVSSAMARASRGAGRGGYAAPGGARGAGRRAPTLGIRTIELLTGDNERTAAALAEQLGVTYRANLLPEDKISDRQRVPGAQGTSW